MTDRDLIAKFELRRCRCKHGRYVNIADEKNLCRMMPEIAD